MAVQAHCTSNAFMTDFRKLSTDAWLADLQQHHDQSSRNIPFGGGSNLNQRGQTLNGNTVFSDPDSELTCNLSASKKRNRDESEQMNLMSHEQQLRLLVNSSSSSSMHRVQEKAGMTGTSIVTGLNLSHHESRMNQSGAASTSGRSQRPVGQDMMAYLYHQQNNEIDAFIRLQNERLRLVLEEKRKMHYRSVLSLLEQQVAKKLREKETELENARTRNAELEEKVQQMSVENQIWQNVARNNEAMVANLKSGLEKVLLLQGAMGQQSREGYGESEVLPSPVAADDAQSCCFFEGSDEDDAQAKVVMGNKELRKLSMCRVCRESETTVLVLPCRHLCLCKECDSKLDSCPVCNAHKSASLQVYIS